MSCVALSKSKRSRRQTKWGLKLADLEEEVDKSTDYSEDMEDQEHGGDDLQEIFDMIDGQNETESTDGFIEEKELEGFLQMLKDHEECSEDDYNLVMNEAGKLCGEDDKLDFDEFVLLVETLEAESYEDYEEEQQGGRQQFFEMVDSNQDGELDASEVDSILKAAKDEGGIDQGTQDFLFQVIGFQASPFWPGTLSQDQFNRFAVLEHHGPASDADWQVLQFCYIDRNHNGQMDTDELKKYLKNEEGLSDDKIAEAIAWVSTYTGTDEQLDMTEFKVLWEEDVNQKRVYKSKDKFKAKFAQTAQSLKKAAFRHRIKKIVKTVKTLKSLKSAKANKSVKTVKKNAGKSKSRNVNATRRLKRVARK